MLKRKEKILISALELLNEKGVFGVTTRNLAEKEGVSEPALYRQFKDKQAIIDQILIEFSSYDEKIENTILEMKMPLKEAIYYYLERYGELYQNYSELTTVLYSMDIYFYHEDNKAFFKANMERRIQFLEEILESGDVESLFGKQVSKRGLAEQIMGIVFFQTFMWRLEARGDDLIERILSQLKLMIAET